MFGSAPALLLVFVLGGLSGQESGKVLDPFVNASSMVCPAEDFSVDGDNFTFSEQPSIVRKSDGYFKKQALKLFDQSGYFRQMWEMVSLSAEKYKVFQNKDLASFVKKILEKHGVSDRSIVVAIAPQGDSAFQVLRGAQVQEGVSVAVILVQDEFFKELSSGAIKAMIAHEAGHLVNNDCKLRFIEAKASLFYQAPITLLFIVLGKLINKSERLKKFVKIRFIVFGAAGYGIVCSINLSRAQWYQMQEFAADAFAAQECGPDAVIEFLKAFVKMIPESSLLGALSTHPLSDQRIAAIMGME